MFEKLRLAFAGTPEFAVPALAATIASGNQLVGVWTQPDRPAGRGRKLTASPIKQVALRHEIPVFQPASLKTAPAQAELAALKVDLLIVVAYGLILPKAVLALPRFGCWNVHASLLPRWRGAAPIQRAIEAGDRQTGVCLMQMTAGLDTGPVLLHLETPIDDQQSAGALSERLSLLGAQVLKDGLTLLRIGVKPVAQAQDDGAASYARKIDKREALLDLTQPAAQLALRVRAFDPWPVAETVLAGERVRIYAAQAVEGHGAAPGTLIAATAAGIDLATGAGHLRLLRVQRPGARPISAAEYLHARPELKRA